MGEEPHLANVLKLVTNFMVIAVNETLSEAFTLAEKAGLKSEPVLEMLQVLFPSLVFEVFAKRIATSDFYSPGANVRLWLKDVGHMRKLADQVAAPLPLADLAYRHLLAALARDGATWMPRLWSRLCASWLASHRGCTSTEAATQ